MYSHSRTAVKRSHLRLGDAGASTKRKAERAAAAAYWSHKIGAALLMLVSVWMLRLLLVDARFAVREITVVSSEHVDAATVQEQVHPRFIGGNPSLFLINSQEVAERVAACAGNIGTVTVHCHLPGRVEVTLGERDDVLLWESNGRYWWVDLNGAVLGAVEQVPAAQEGAEPLTVIHDVDGWAPHPEGYIAGVPWEMLRELALALPAAHEYEYARGLGLVVRVTGDHWPVYLGHDGTPTPRWRSCGSSWESCWMRAEPWLISMCAMRVGLFTRR